MKKMKKAVIISIFLYGLIGAYSFVYAAPIENMPHTLVQPDGETVECFVSGDEYFNYMHDADGNIIIKNYDTGEYVYAKILDEEVVPGSETVRQSGLEKTRSIDGERIQFSDIPDTYLKKAYETSSFNQDTAIHLRGLDYSGKIHRWNDKKINNIVIFIDFSDVTFSNQDISFYEGVFNDNDKSLKSWFHEASYGKAQVVSDLYPKSPGTAIAMYRDIHPRSFYEKKQKPGTVDETAYYDENGREVEQKDLEHPLLKRAIDAVKEQIPAELEIDGDNDGFVDCVTFVIAGQSGEWNDLLWSHKWALYSENERINGKRVYEYILVLENELIDRGANVLMHEIFHMYGAPDLYHYSHDGKDSVGKWDIMATSQGQMTSMYMKYKYGGWIDEIPEIKASGTYTLNKTSLETNNCYVIRTPFSGDEFFVLEFRAKEGNFDQDVINGSGLVIYRIDAAFHGNSGYDDIEVFDEVFVAEESPENRYYPSYGDSAALNLRSGKEAGIVIDNFSVTGDQISFHVQLTSEKAAYFKDYRIAQAIAGQLNKSIDAITEEDLLNITELYINPVREYGLSLDLEGMEKLVNLRKFTAENCKIADISPLETLTKLTELRLYKNNITDINALANLQSLKILTLRGNLIRDYSPLSGCYNRLTAKDFSFDTSKDIRFSVNSYSAAGEAKTIRVSLSDTAPEFVYLKFEKYTDEGTLEKESALLEYWEYMGYFAIPEGFECGDGYVKIKGYERADGKQLCVESGIRAVRFDANGGVMLSCGRMDVVENSMYGILPNTARKGYLFDGWYTKAAGGIRITGQNVVNDSCEPVLYAHWSKVSVNRVSLQKPKNLRGTKMKVKWKKAADADGYQITYAPNKKLRKAKTKTTVKNTLTVKKLKKGKKYYVKVRAFKLDSTGERVYGEYSKIQKVKIKK